MNLVSITTDSKYVKNGITEWIKEWKVNDWKTTKRKGDRDVLNKDLWLILDFLQEQLTVDWCLAEGHKDSEGNKKADDLAKKGISMEVTYWQYTACKWYEEQCCDVIDMSGALFVSKGKEQTEETALKPQYIASPVRASVVKMMMQYSAKSASFRCIQGVLTYLNINYIVQIIFSFLVF